MKRLAGDADRGRRTVGAARAEGRGRPARSLAFRFAAAVVALTVPAAALFAALVAAREVRDQAGIVVAAVRTVAQGNAASALLCAYNLDPALCDAVVRSVAGAPGVVGVTVLGETGEVLAAAEGPPAQAGSGLAGLLVDPPSALVLPLVAGPDLGVVEGRRFGTLEVRVDPRRGLAGIGGRAAGTAALLVLLAVLVGGGVLLAYEAVVGRRLRRLAATVEGMDPDSPDPDLLAAHASDDEIGLLADRFGASIRSTVVALRETQAASAAARLAEDWAAREAARFRDLVDNSLQGVLVHSDFRILYANDAYARIYGMERGDEVVAIGDLMRLIPADQHDRARADYELGMRSEGRAVRYLEDIRNETVAGEAVWIDLSERPILWDGEPAMMTLVVDATGRHVAREEAARAASRLEMALGVARVAVYDADIETGAAWTSPELAEMLGLPRARAGEPRFREAILAPEDAERVRAGIRAFLADPARDTLVQEYRVVAADGRRRWMLDQSRAVRDGAGRAVRHVGAMADVDDLKRAQTEAAEAAAGLDLALRAARAGAFVLDVRTGRATVGDAFAASLGYADSAALAGETGWWLDGVEPEDRRSVEDAIAGLIDGADTVERAEFRFRRADGATIWLAMRAHAVGGAAGGRAEKVAGVLMDIDRQKRADLELARYRDELEVLVAERTEQLRLAQTELAQAERQAGLATLVAGVAHEVNTPLGVCLTAASTLAENIGDVRAKAEAKALRRSDLEAFLDRVGSGLGIVTANLERAATLVRRFKQVAVDQASGERRRIELGAYVEDVVGTLAPQLRRRPVEVVVRRTGEAAMTTDPGAIAQVVTNLLTNALDHAFAPEQEGRVEVTVGPSADGRARIRVTDDGRGMTEEVQARIFDPFFTTRRGQGGSGLGLSIVWNLVTGPLGGRIAVCSTPGGGTTFDIDLPLGAPRT